MSETQKSIADWAHDTFGPAHSKLGLDLTHAIELKMQVNRKRTWKLDGSGHGYHERPKSVTL